MVCVQFFSLKNYGQTEPASEFTLKDSIALMQELMNLLDSVEKPRSYALVNIGIGNKLFSVRNNALNAKQNVSGTMIYSPMLAYYHKTGLSISAAANLLNDGKSFGVNQYSITPAFDLSNNKNIGLGISYTHYFVADKYSPFSSPVQDDFFASFVYKKTWLRPGISLGYSTGEYNEAFYKDTVINGVTRHRYDSVTYKLNAFSLMATASHEFSWYGLLNNRDGLAFTPTVIANAGSGNTNIFHNTNAALLIFLLRKGKLPKLQTSKFEMQSLGLNIDINYTIGKLILNPQLYMDYYLPATDDERFSQLFTFNMAYIF